jgi:hypothetical protein
VLPRDAARASIGRWAICLYYWALAPVGLPKALAPELDPDPELEPELELPLEPELMPGHECFPGGAPEGGVVPVFAPAGGVVVLGVVDVVVGVADCVVEAPVPVEPEDAAPALEMPANAPPVAIAPATIVAPSSFDVFMRSNLHLWVGWLCRSMVRHGPKASQRPT